MRTKLHWNCKSCNSASSTECINCEDGFEVTTRATNGVGECFRTSSCHEMCDTCSGPNEDDCLSQLSRLQRVLTLELASAAQTLWTRINLSVKGGWRSSSPTTVPSLGLETYEVAQAQVKFPNNGKQMIRHKLLDVYLETISGMGNRFIFADLMKVTIIRVTSPTDYDLRPLVKCS